MKPGGQDNPVYAELLGETLDAAEWEALLEEAARCGLLRLLVGRIYELHPTLPVFLRRQLVAAVGEDGLTRLDSEFLNFYTEVAAHFFDAARKADRNAIAGLGIEEANLLRALRLAEKREQWDKAIQIVQTLYEFYEVTSRTDEWRALRTALLDIIGRQAKTSMNHERANLWLSLISNEAYDAIELGNLDHAESGYKQVLDYMLSLNQPDMEANIARIYHELGRIAQGRQQFDIAEQEYKKALAFFERMGLESDAAGGYHQLGTLADERQQFEHAEQWYKKAIEIRERLGLDRDAATDYHHLGILAEKRQQLDPAEQYYQKALTIFERLGLQAETATVYHQLGTLAEERQQFGFAEQWYKNALAIAERLGLRVLMASTLAQLGLLRRKQGRLPESIAWFGKALMIAAQYKMPVGGRILRDLARLMKSMGEQEFVAVWRQAFGEEPPLDRLREAMKHLE